MVFIYTTCAKKEEAERLAKLLLEKRLAACIDYWPIRSMFHWEGHTKHIEEVMMMIVTFEPKIETVNNLIAKNHSYSVPLIGSVDVRRIYRPYKEWMSGEVV